MGEKKYRGNYKVSMVVFVLLIILCLIFCWYVIDIPRKKKIIGNGMIVDATVTGYNNVDSMYVMSPALGFDYCYTDENGTVYKGSTTQTIVHGYAEAEKWIEEKRTVKIYIDGKGRSLPVGNEPSEKLFIASIVLSCVLVPATVAFCIIFVVPKKQKNKEE